MNPERWHAIRLALEEAMMLAGPERAAYLERVGQSDPALRSEIESLLLADTAAGSGFLAPPPYAAEHEPLPHNVLAGRRVGPYQLIAALGAGGMGEVYRAVRTDEFTQEVAIKLVRASSPGASPFIAERLRTERQILASFNHPNIARLLDGGTTDEGVPYLVMELIEGQPITAYCDALKLSASARLGLFIEVCEAVQYAHQRMVIHRDLKPSNILVTAEGGPKLLDFGIAKILEPSAFAGHGDTTITALRLLTPSYASPEQLAGQTVTAASDVFSLGVILHELLTGVRPFSRTDRPERGAGVPEELITTLPRRPSSLFRETGRRRAPDAPDLDALCGLRGATPQKLRKQLQGDLDNIILMALRTEPERRYATVEQLARDIHLHLAHLPVIARKPTFAYSAGRFISRHVPAVIASAAVAVALVAGIIITTREAQIAEEQRGRAERRFNDVRHLASTLIFDIHDAIRDLPGAAPSRDLIIKTALKYLDSLAQESAGDPALQGELASAYLRLGDLQGLPRQANEGDYAGALGSYQRAIELYRAATRIPGPGNAELRRALVLACGKLSDVLWYQRHEPEGALSYVQQALAASEPLLAGAPRDPKARALHAIVLMDYGYKLYMIRKDVTEGLYYLKGSIPDLETLALAQPADSLAQRRLALAYFRTADVLASRKENTEALALNLKALEVLNRLTRAAPENTDFRHLQAWVEHQLADVLPALGQLDEALQHERAAISAYQGLAAADPGIALYRVNLALSLTGMASLELERGHPEQALALLREALEKIRTLPAESASADLDYARASAEAKQGDAYAALANEPHVSRRRQAARWRSAREAYAQALGSFELAARSWAQSRDAATELRSKIELCDRKLSELNAPSGQHRGEHGEAHAEPRLPPPS
jgi:non-specific serine/threonine protein kinase/serine/threonine-protein kinase